MVIDMPEYIEKMQELPAAEVARCCIGERDGFEAKTIILQKELEKADTENTQLRTALANYQQVTKWLRSNGFESFGAFVAAFDQVKRELHDAKNTLDGLYGAGGQYCDDQISAFRDRQHFQQKEERVIERLTKRLEDGTPEMDCSTCEAKNAICTGLSCRNRLRDRLADIEDTLGDKYDLDHICDLLQAEKDGKLVVKPFKSGTRFILCDDPDRDITFTGNVLFEVKSSDGDTEWWGTEELAELKNLRQAGDNTEVEEIQP